MFRIKRDDIVYCIKGKDRSKTGKVIKIFPESNKAVVEGMNIIQKHLRRKQQEQQSGIVKLEAPLSLSNLMFFCKNCNKGVRVGFKTLVDKSKARYCKRCSQTI